MEKIIKTLCSKRNTEIPVTVFDSGNENPGLVLMVHGFKAERSEGGRFYEVAEKLCEEGVNTICMGFPGCDESKEDFINYSLTNCLDDIETSYEYMLDTYNINKDHMGIIGYSMGGRLTSIYQASHPEFKVIGLWAAASYNGFEDGKFLGADAKEAEEVSNKDGYYMYHNGFDNTDIKLSKQLVNDFGYDYKPEDLMKEYKGAAIICQGNKDESVKPETTDIIKNSLVNAKKVEMLLIDGANHGFGLWDNHPEQSKTLVDGTFKFFKENL